MTAEELVYSAFPPRIRREVMHTVGLSGEAPMEIHICVGSGSSVRFPSKKIYLGISVSETDTEEILAEFTGRALYAHMDTLKEGFISPGEGVRVGVCGQARYEGGALVGVYHVSSLLVRIPHGECDFANKLFEAFLLSKRGLLIFAPPSGGKTTALRALLLKVCALSGERVSVIDERSEIDMGDFSSCDIDVFKGYRRSHGLEIALRVMSPTVIAVDELGSERENTEMLRSLLTGVRFIATAHAESLQELKKRKNLEPFFEMDIFDVYARIFNTDGHFFCEITTETKEECEEKARDV